MELVLKLCQIETNNQNNFWTRLTKPSSLAFYFHPLVSTSPSIACSAREKNKKGSLKRLY